MEELLARFNLEESRALGALIIFTLALVGAKVADFTITRLFKRMARLTDTDLDDRLINLIHRPLFYSVLIYGTVQAATYLGPPAQAAYYIKAVLYTLLALMWCLAVLRASDILAEDVIAKLAGAAGFGKEIMPLISNITKVLAVGAVVMVVLSVWKVNITPLLASAGLIGVAVALAAKDTLANFFGGISIFIDRPYTIGDYIVLDGGERGEVMHIGIRSTRIITRDNVMIAVPNAIIANTKIINESAPVPQYRIRIKIGVAYGTDIKKVEDLLTLAATENSNTADEPAPRVRFREFGDSSLKFELLCWIKEPSLRGLTLHQINSAIYNSFNANGVVIPFPQRDVHIYNKT